MIKEYIKKEEPLYLDGYIHDSSLSLEEFISLFLLKLNDKHFTLTQYGETQCYPGKHRSLGDIYLICKKFYNNITIDEVKEHLLNLGNKLVGHYCTTIKKRIYEHADSNKCMGWIQSDKNYKDEFGDIIEYR